MKTLNLQLFFDAMSTRVGTRAVVAGVAILLAAASYFTGAYTRTERVLCDYRDSKISKPSSQTVVIVGLDQKTFDELGGLPLRRAHYARALQEMVNAGAKRIYIDVFFQAASNTEDDQLFEDAIIGAGRKLALPRARIGSQSSKLMQPIDRFSQHANLVAADVQVGKSHLVTAQGRHAADEVPAPSVASWLLHGEAAQPGLSNIDVRIDLNSIPHLSFLDVLNGTERESLRDKLVVVGVTSPRVLQPLVIRKYGVIERAELLALATETAMLPGKPQVVPWSWQLVGWLALSLALGQLVGWAKPWFGFVCTLLGMLSIIGGAVYLQENHAITFNISIPMVTMILTFAGISIAEKPAFRNLKTLLQSLVRKVDLSLARLFNSSTDAIVTFSPDGRILAFNAAAEKMLGFPAEAVKGRNLQEVLPGSAERLIESMQHSQPGRFEATFRCKAGKARHVDLAFNAMPSEDGWIGYASLRDITDLKEREIHLERQAKVDPLTGLPNRMAFEQQLKSLDTDSDSSRAIMLLDLNRFKQVNDTLGHAVGDELLKEVARRFEGVVGALGAVFRLGGDEFTIVLDCVDRPTIERVAGHLVEAICSIDTIGGHEIDCGTSIGIAIYATNDQDLHQVVKQADQAMYEAKRSGSGFQFASQTPVSPAISINAPVQNTTQNI